MENAACKGGSVVISALLVLCAPIGQVYAADDSAKIELKWPGTTVAPGDAGVPESQLQLRRKVQLLEAAGKMDEATQALEQSFRQSGDLSLLRDWIALDTFRIDRLKRQLCRQDHLTSYAAPDFTPTMKERLAGAAAGTVVVGGGWVGNLAAYASAREITRRRVVQDEEGRPVAVLSADSVADGVRQFDITRVSADLAKKTIREAIVASSNEGRTTALLGIAKEQGGLLKDLSDIRCHFVSYDVISPQLARCDQLVFLSSNAKFLRIGHSADRLKEAAKALAFEPKLLEQANKEVREQFLSVLERMKGLAGKAEFEELTAIAALLANPKVGPRTWLDPE